MKSNIQRAVKGAASAALSILMFSACGDLLDVSDPQQYTSDDLDAALPAVANGVEGAMHQVVDSYVIEQALLGDEYQHTGTWSGYDEIDHGRFQYGTTQSDGTQNSWLRTQWFAVDAEERFKRVLGEAEAAASELTAQVRLGGAFADLYMGMEFCEGPAEPSGPAVTDMQLLQQAVTKFTGAIQTANAAGRADFAMAAQAGRAQAYLVMGDLASAASDAAAIPDGFSYDAVFNVQSTNSVVTLTTKTFNEAAGLMYVWWPQIDLSTSDGFMRDPWTDVPDPRIPVFFDGEVATDNETPHYSQWKYNDQTDDIPLVHSDLMRLIEAENLASQSDFPGAMAILNTLRANVGLAALPDPADAAEMQNYLLSERFAELFMEGQRMVDLHRFDLVDDIFTPLADGERPGTGRPTKFSMSDDEAVVNANIQNDLTARCLPKT